MEWLGYLLPVAALAAILAALAVRRYGGRRVWHGIGLGLLWPFAFAWRKRPRLNAWDIVYWIVFVLPIAVGLHWLIVTYAWDTVFTFTIDGREEPFKWGHILMGLLWAYMLGSWIVVPETKVASQRFLGMPFRHLNSGPAFVPLWICTIKLFLGTYQQRLLPGKPEELFHEEGEQPIPEGKVPPLRVTFAQDDTEEAGRDPLNKRITAVVFFTVTWAIDRAHRFERTIGNGGEDGIDAIREANRQLSDTGTRFLTHHYSTQTVARALTTKEASGVSLQQVIDEVTEGWGVDIKRAEVKNFHFNHGLNRSIVGVPTAVNDARIERERASGIRDATITKAEGDRRRRELEGQGDGEGVKAYMEATGLTAQDAQAAEVARALALGGNVVIVGGAGMADLMGIVEAAARRSRPASDAAPAASTPTA